nr:hypothetical protein [uncultured Roseococcus sp.]
MIGIGADTSAARLERALTENEQLQTSLHAAQGLLREAAARFRLYALDNWSRWPPLPGRAERDDAIAARIEALVGPAPAAAGGAPQRDSDDA